MKQEKVIVEKQKEVIRPILYTFIMDYLGGIYVSQVKSSSTKKAMQKWIQELDITQIEGFTNTDRVNIIKKKFIDDIPVPLKGLKNVWFFSVETKKGYGYVNMIKSYG